MLDFNSSKSRVALATMLARTLPEFRGKRRALDLMLRGLGRTVVPMGNYQLALDLSDRFERSAAIGHFQRDVINALKRHLRPGDCFCDCGAHVGVVSCAIADRVGPNGLVVAFEPSPETYRRLAENFALNEGANSCRKIGIEKPLGANVDEAVVLHVSEQHGWSSLSQQATVVGESLGAKIVDRVNLMTTTLDAVFLGTETCASSDDQQPLKKPNVIKIDVEGWEEEVLLGAKELLSAYPPVAIVVERNDEILRSMGKSFGSIAGLLGSYGYHSNRPLARDVVFVRSQ